MAAGLSAFMFFWFRAEGSAWHACLKRPGFTPPDVVSIIGWASVFALMAFVAQRQICRSNIPARNRLAVAAALIPLWSYAMYARHSVLPGFLLLVCILVADLCAMRQTRQGDRLSSVLILIAMVWVAYQAVISYAVYMMN